MPTTTETTAAGAAATPTVRFAWSAEDTAAAVLAAEGALELALVPSDAALRATHAAAGGGGAVVLAPSVQLTGGADHVLRVTGYGATALGAYLSVCVAGDTTRELLAAEAAGLCAAAEAGASGEAAAAQVTFRPPADGAYTVRIRARAAAAGSVAVVLRRALLVEMPDDGCGDGGGGAAAAASSSCGCAAAAAGSVFPDLAPMCATAEATLAALAAAAVQTAGGEERFTPRTAAGHAMVLRAVERDAVSTLLQGTKPALDLRSVYGPVASRAPLLDARMRFRTNAAANDLPRDAYGAPIVADARCDRTYLDAQLHLLLLRFHNRVMDHFANANAQQGASIPDDVLFERARRCVVTHWQWAVFYDTVQSLVDRATFRDVCASGQRFVQVYAADAAGAAAPAEYLLCLAHLPLFLERGIYPLARGGHLLALQQATVFVHGALPTAPLDVRALFDPERCPAGAVEAYVPHVAPPADGEGASGAAAADPQAQRVLAALEAGDARLASGHAVALTTGVAPLGDDELQAADRTGVVRTLGISVRRLPLLLYVLKEAEVRGSGRSLTGVGSRLLTETVRSFIWSAPADACCFRNNWRPSLPRSRSETYSMRDLVEWTLGSIPG